MSEIAVLALGVPLGVPDTSSSQAISRVRLVNLEVGLESSFYRCRRIQKLKCGLQKNVRPADHLNAAP